MTLLRNKKTHLVQWFARSYETNKETLEFDDTSLTINKNLIFLVL